MKIGIDIRTLMDAQYSGVSEYTYSLLKEIFRLDNNNDYKLFYNSAADMSGRIPKFKESNVKIIHTNYPNKIFNYLLQKTAGRPRVDQLLGVDLFFMPHINFIALSEQCQKIITIHDLSFLRYPEFFSSRKNLWHKIINVKKLLKQFDVIVAVSENTKADIMELCRLPENKIQVIYSGVNREFQPLDKQDKHLLEVKAKYNLPDKFIFCLGALEPRKNIAGLIKAYDRLAAAMAGENYFLVLAGSRGWKNKEIFSAIAGAQHQDKIKLLGYIDRADKVYLYNLASLFVYPSFYEGFGFPPLEAAACGLPVIAGNNSSLPETIGTAAVLINPYNSGEIYAAMLAILSDKELKNKLSSQGLLSARRYDWTKTAAGYLRIFTS